MKETLGVTGSHFPFLHSLCVPSLLSFCLSNHPISFVVSGHQAQLSLHISCPFLMCLSSTGGTAGGCTSSPAQAQAPLGTRGCGFPLWDLELSLFLVVFQRMGRAWFSRSISAGLAKEVGAGRSSGVGLGWCLPACNLS